MEFDIKDNFPTGIVTEFKDKKVQIALEQLRSTDRTCIVKKLGVIEKEAQNKVLDRISVIFQK